MRFITEKRLSQAQLGRTRTLASIKQKKNRKQTTTKQL